MLKEIFEKKPAIQKIKIGETLICDRCKSVIYKHTISDKPYGNNRTFVDWFNVTTGHDDWGNDSVESREYKSICSDCFSAACADYFKKSHNTKYKENTEYIEIEHRWHNVNWERGDKE